MSSVDLATRRFSHSLVDTYTDCPRKAQYRYIDELPMRKPQALIKGSACDTAWNASMLNKIETEEDLPLPDLLERAEQAFRDDVREAGGIAECQWSDPDPKDGARRALDSTLALTKAWLIQLAPDILPTAVQVRLDRLMPSGREVVGFLDAEATVDGRPAVMDNKTASRRMNQGDADRGLQPSAYAWLRGEPIDFVFARAIATPKGSTSAEFVWTSRNETDIKTYGEILAGVEQGWMAGNFPPNPASRFCGTGCPYWSVCPVGRGVTQRQGGKP